ncbi:MAG: tetratricopeptide repeat protein, partial [Anaerolineales bacterium]
MLSPNLKLTPPRRRPNILRRVRLLDTLHNNIHRKVSFVCAPAGYGKTTLLVDFAEDIDAVVYWNRISSDENNLAAFYENVVQAFQIHHPELEKASSLLFDKGTPSPQDLAYRLVNQLGETLQDFSIFILDDYHLVSEEPEIVDFIESFISYLPDHLRLLIGSRNVYGIPTALLYVQEQLAIISEDDLKFTKDEIEQLCWKYYHIQLSDKQSQMIMEQAEGWIVAILLALRSENLTVAIPKILGAREHVYTYLAEEVIKTLPAELINFLYATSLVDEFTAPMANHLLGIENAGEVIKHLDELNLFLTAASDSQTETRYRYHQLFAEFLQENLKAVQPQDVPDLHYRIASWYEEQGLHIKAVSHYFQAGEKRRAVCLIDQISREIYLSGQSHLLEQWYQRISSSEELVSQAPELLLNLAKFKANQGEYRQCELLLGYAEKPLIEREDYPNYANLLVSLGMSYRFLGRHEEAHDMALRVQAEVEKHNLDRYYWIQAERLKGVNAYYLGKPGKALESLKVAASALREMIEPTFLPRQAHELFGTLMDIGYVALAGGDIFDAHISYREALDLAKRIQSNSTVIALAYNNYGYLKYLMGDYPQAWKYYLQGLEVAEHSNNEWIMTNLYNGRGDILRELGDWKQAEAAYTKALQLSEKLEKNRSMASAYSGLGEVEILKKDFNQAMYYLREKARIQKKDINEPEFLFNFAQVYLAMGQTNLAAETFEAVIDAQEDEDQSKSAPESVVLHFDYARSLISLGQINKAKEHLRSSLELTARLGYDQFLVNAIRKNYKTVEKALKTMNSPQADSLLERARKPLPSLDDLVLDEQEDETEEAVVLSVFGLNHGEVRVNGSVLSSR